MASVLERPGYRLKLAQHALRTRMDAALRTLGITAPQYAVLTAIDQQPGLSNAALARAAFVTAQSMQGIVANLERAGLLARSQDPNHGRVLNTVLTPAGRRVLARAHTAVDGIEAAMLRGLSRAETATLGDLLASCAANLRAR